jgi:hypothetical protein
VEKLKGITHFRHLGMDGRVSLRRDLMNESRMVVNQDRVQWLVAVSTVNNLGVIERAEVYRHHLRESHS